MKVNKNKTDTVIIRTTSLSVMVVTSPSFYTYFNAPFPVFQKKKKIKTSYLKVQINIFLFLDTESCCFDKHYKTYRNCILRTLKPWIFRSQTCSPEESKMEKKVNWEEGGRLEGEGWCVDKDTKDWYSFPEIRIPVCGHPFVYRNS